jgi:N-acylglucosamine-6-phosphate 2-epimerase
MTAKRTALLESLTGQLVVSCQAASGSPLEPAQHIVALAQAAVLGGTKGVRIEGVGNVAAVRAAVTVPIIGIVKATRADSDVFITTTSADVVALSDAGADIIAFDATQRPRPETVASLCGTVQQRGMASMADISAIDEAKAAIAAGADLVGTTLSGYTDYSPAPEEPDFADARTASRWRVFCRRGPNLDTRRSGARHCFGSQVRRGRLGHHAARCHCPSVFRRRRPPGCGPTHKWR